jgi:hypothetical protein
MIVYMGIFPYALLTMYETSPKDQKRTGDSDRLRRLRA